MKLHTYHCVGCGQEPSGDRIRTGHLKLDLADYAVPMNITASWCIEECLLLKDSDGLGCYGWMDPGDKIVVYEDPSWEYK